MRRAIVFVLATIIMCFPYLFYSDANAQVPPQILRVIRALRKPPHSISFLQKAGKTPLGQALSASTLKKAWQANTAFQVEVLKHVMTQDPNALERLISGTGRIPEANVAQIIDDLARYHALGGPPAEIRGVDSVEFLETYKRIKENTGARGCRVATEICVGSNNTVSFSFACGGAQIQLTTRGQVSLTTTSPDGRKYSVPIVNPQ